MESPDLGLSLGDNSLRMSNESDSAQDFHNDSLIWLINVVRFRPRRRDRGRVCQEGADRPAPSAGPRWSRGALRRRLPAAVQNGVLREFGCQTDFSRSLTYLLGILQ